MAAERVVEPPVKPTRVLEAPELMIMLPEASVEHTESGILTNRNVILCLMGFIRLVDWKSLHPIEFSHQ